MKKLRLIVSASLLAFLLALVGAPASNAATAAQSGAVATTTAPASAVATAAVVVPTVVAASFSAYGCVGLLNAKQWQVLAFALGYCPSVWVLQQTAWGRSITNWVVNGLCRMPWVVRAATWGRYSSC